MGFIGIANDLVNLLRCLLVNPTFGSATYFQSPAAATKDCLIEPPPEGTPDDPRTRGNVRVGMNLLGLAFLGATVPGIIANANYSNAITRQGSADSTAKLRWVSVLRTCFSVLRLHESAIQIRQYSHRPCLGVRNSVLRRLGYHSISTYHQTWC